MSPFVIQTIAWAASLAALFGSARTDLKMRVIPNELVVLIAVSGVVLSLGLRPGQTWISLLAAAFIFFALGILCHYNLIGGGDVKLVTAVTLLVPPDRIGLLLVEIALAGGLLSSAYFAGSHILRSMPMSQGNAFEAGRVNGLQHWLKDERARIASGKSVPYALAVLAGVIGYLASELP